MLKKNKVLDEWNRERTLFKRGMDGKLLPKEVPILGEFDKSIVMIPKTIGECDEIGLELLFENINSKQLKAVFFNDCLVLPKIYSFSTIKPDYIKKIYYTLLFESGYEIDPNKIKNKLKIAKRKGTKSSTKLKVYKLIKADYDLAKYDFLLHEAGYTMFDIPKLTRQEANLILKSSNEITKRRSSGNKGKNIKR